VDAKVLAGLRFPLPSPGELPVLPRFLAGTASVTVPPFALLPGRSYVVRCNATALITRADRSTVSFTTRIDQAVNVDFSPFSVRLNVSSIGVPLGLNAAIAIDATRSSDPNVNAVFDPQLPAVARVANLTFAWSCVRLALSINDSSVVLSNSTCSNNELRSTTTQSPVVLFDATNMVGSASDAELVQYVLTVNVGSAVPRDRVSSSSSSPSSSSASAIISVLPPASLIVKVAVPFSVALGQDVGAKLTLEAEVLDPSGSGAILPRHLFKFAWKLIRGNEQDEDTLVGGGGGSTDDDDDDDDDGDNNLGVLPAFATSSSANLVIPPNSLSSCQTYQFAVSVVLRRSKSTKGEGRVSLQTKCPPSLGSCTISPWPSRAASRARTR
jgi:hypothetical protein